MGEPRWFPHVNRRGSYPRRVERVVRFSPRAVLLVIGLVLATLLALRLLWLTRDLVVWLLVALFLAMALNPAVEWVQRHGVRRRGLAVAIVVAAALLVAVGIGALFIPTLVSEIHDFANAVPGYVDDLTKGRGKLGFLERNYQIVEKIRKALSKGGVTGVLGLTGTAVSVTKSIFNAIIAVVTITFLTLFMLLEGPIWVDRFYALLPDRSRHRWRRVGGDIYRSVGGYVTGNLAISVLAGIGATIVLLVLGVDFAVALGVLVGLFDLIPLAGATIAAVIVSTVGFLHSTTAGIVLVVYFVLYQQLENQVIQPLVYGRTVRLSPLVVLVAVLAGAQLAGIIGALGAIPIAAAIQVVVLDILAQRGSTIVAPPEHYEAPPAET
jgi:predicted PurR-regulated permease PerM